MKRKKRQNKHRRYDHVIEKFKAIYGDRYDYSNTKITAMNDPFEVKCNTCGFIFNSLPYNHLKGHGCRKCGYKERSVKRTSNLSEFQKKADKIHGEKYIYHEYESSNKKIKIYCKKCKQIFEQTPDDHLQGKGCPKCNFSKGEELIDKILSRNNITFERQFKLPGYKFRYDFYLPEFGILIEYHGKQHYEPIDAFGGKKEFKEIQKRDAFKRSLARDYKLRLIELSYKEFRVIESTFERLLMTYINNCKPFNIRRNSFGSSRECSRGGT